MGWIGDPVDRSCVIIGDEEGPILENQEINWPSENLAVWLEKAPDQGGFVERFTVLNAQT
jgi:hypothetical protein